MAFVGDLVQLLFCMVGVVTAVNNRPIIGILSQEFDIDTQGHYPNYTGYIAASYVKFLESSGSRVVPVWINQTTDYYEYIVNSVNGLLLPGGGAEFNATDGYATAGWQLYKLAEQKNDAGVYFPVWGTCLGFELLFVLSANQTDLRKACNITHTPLSLTFRPDHRSSRLYKDDPDDVLSILKQQNVTFNNHFWCVTEQELIASNIADEWHILSVNNHKGIEFISSVEHKKYPFYGVQFHPEKNAFEWKIESIPHSADAILVEQFYGNFFISEARKNNNSFPSIKEEHAALIYNYPVTYTADKIDFEQTYLFVIEQQEVPTTTTSTTTTTTTTTTPTTTEATTTSTVTTTDTTERDTPSSTASSGVKSAQSITKPSAASTHNSVPYTTLCITVFFVWLVKQ